MSDRNDDDLEAAVRMTVAWIQANPGTTAELIAATFQRIYNQVTERFRDRDLARVGVQVR